MDEKTFSNSDELERLRAENQELRRQRDLFVVEHRWGAHLAALIILGPRLTESIRQWLSSTSRQNPLPLEETANLAAALVRRLLSVGLVGLLIPTAPLIWQNLLIRDQNQYFREQTSELRKQIALQEEQGDLTTRKDLLETVYSGKRNGISMRTRTEALKALVALDNKLIGQRKLEEELVNVRAVDLSCNPLAQEECADLSKANLIRADFTGANLRGADFSYADLRGGRFIAADLSDANLQGTSLDGTQFRDSWPIDTSNPAAATINKKLVLAARPLNLQKDNLYQADFIIERILLAEDLKAAINKITRAAIVNQKTDFYMHDVPEIAFMRVGFNTLLPLGTLAPDAPLLWKSNSKA